KAALKKQLFAYDPTKHKTKFAKRDDMAKRFAASAKNDKKRVDAVHKALKNKPKSKVGKRGGIPLGTTKSWSLPLGRKNILACEMAAKLETKGDTNGLSITGSGNVLAYLANIRIPVLDANCGLTVPRQGKSKVNITVSVLGIRAHSFQPTVNTTFEKKDEFKKSLDKSVSFTTMIGPIPVTARLGIQGTVGLRYFVGLRPLFCDVQVVPFAEVKAYAQLGIGIPLASVGVGG